MSIGKIPLNAEPRPLQPGAGIPARSTEVVDNVKLVVLAMDRLIIDGETGDAEIQKRLSEACAQVTDHPRDRIVVNRLREDRVWCARFFTRSIHVSALGGCLRAVSTLASPDIAEGR